MARPVGWSDDVPVPRSGLSIGGVGLARGGEQRPGGAMPTTPTTMPSTPVAAPDIDLTDPVALDELLASRHARRFSEEHIVDWLRSSGGTLAERITSNEAAEPLEDRHPDDDSPHHPNAP